MSQCPICNKEMFKVVKLIVKAPSSMLAYTKTNMRSKEVKILGVEEEDPLRWMCPEHGTLNGIIEKLEHDDR